MTLNSMQKYFASNPHWSHCRVEDVREWVSAAVSANWKRNKTRERERERGESVDRF